MLWFPRNEIKAIDSAVKQNIQSFSRIHLRSCFTLQMQMESHVVGVLGQVILHITRTVLLYSQCSRVKQINGLRSHVDGYL